ncbi:sucrose-6-phosphate hydrolase [Bacillus sp. MUM 13]|nr:sucrose-6-phosphate hydrolase [Bacillus sp. MUM 13]
MKEKEILLYEQAYGEVKKHQDNVQDDYYRLNYHLMPPVGLMNDPNGLIQFNGIYHVFYQWNPFDTKHGAKFWGHFTSSDMVTWKEEPIALAPDEWYDKNGCYSGSAVEWEGKLYLFYTGNVKREDGTRETHQCIAVSEDGMVFEKLGPILHLPCGYTAHFRDPKVWKHEDKWYMVLGAQTLEEKGAAVLFTSENLFDWEESGRIAGTGMNELGYFGYMWECPDLINLNGRDILLISPQGLKPSGHFYHNLFQSGYFSGKLDYKNHTYLHGDFTELDRGFDFYAPQTFMDEKGRTIMYGWMGITDEAEAYQPTISHHWVHALTLPRELEWRNGKIYQKPVEELRKLRKNEAVCEKVQTEEGELQLKNVNTSSAELLFSGIKAESGTYSITFRNEASLEYDADKKELSLHRRSMKTNDIETRTCSLHFIYKIHVFMDHSSLEIFVNDGEEVFTARYFPVKENESIVFKGHAEFQLTKWALC